MARKMIRLGPTPTQWGMLDEDVSAEPAGRYLRVRFFGPTESLALKFQYFYKRMEGGSVLHWYVPLPADKDDLRRSLLEIAEHEGIDLSELPEHPKGQQAHQEGDSP